MARLPLDAEIRAKNIVEQLGGVWRRTRGECRCPAHDDGSPSLSVRLGDSAILFHCFAGCTVLEVLKALQRRKLHDRTTVAMPEGKPKRDMGALALRLWNASAPIAGTLAEDYLLARGLEATARDIERPAKPRHRPDPSMLCDEPEFQIESLAK